MQPSEEVGAKGIPDKSNSMAKAWRKERLS